MSQLEDNERRLAVAQEAVDKSRRADKRTKSLLLLSSCLLAFLVVVCGILAWQNGNYAAQAADAAQAQAAEKKSLAEQVAAACAKDDFKSSPQGKQVCQRADQVAKDTAAVPGSKGTKASRELTGEMVPRAVTAGMGARERPARRVLLERRGVPENLESPGPQAWREALASQESRERRATQECRARRATPERRACRAGTARMVPRRAAGTSLRTGSPTRAPRSRPDPPPTPAQHQPRPRARPRDGLALHLRRLSAEHGHRLSSAEQIPRHAP
ncbi:hypothetical protein [Arthrobacter woluwensis]|uniref:Uncharacterized protein n=1 Tax=Arthrobacter woluwensis TaxID=156980 RepID=A0A1H4WNB5_9MICC|nr:hypothetical protein [Arthrobacter woluwensis]SEC94238.1 hypothetical protein SAMN04489745_3525 [Arthrobacter woluwensis]